MIHADSVKAWEAESETFRNLIRELAAENGRLQAEIAELRDSVVAADRAIKHSHAEADRLREVLRSEGANRYWEGRWRDEKAENERLRGLLREATPYIEGAQNTTSVDALLATEKLLKRVRGN